MPPRRFRGIAWLRATAGRASVAQAWQPRPAPPANARVLAVALPVLAAAALSRHCAGSPVRRLRWKRRRRQGEAELRLVATKRMLSFPVARGKEWP
jgi:hypothetical protein